MSKQVALYARVSSEQQSDAGTVQSQVAALIERIQAERLSITEELKFIDDGFSGATLIRPALERLRDAVYAGTIDRLYILSPDRLARKFAYQILLTDEFRRAGVEVIFLNRQVGDTPEDELLLQVQGIVSEYERAKIMERTRRGRLHAARHGAVSVLGKAPYGYRYVPKKEADGEAHYEILFEEARVAQQIFEWVGRERITMHEVCRRLAANSVKTRSGNVKWDRGTIQGILKNPAYMGQAAFGKTRIGPPRPRLRQAKGVPDPAHNAHSVYDVPADEWIRIPVPALITPALFEVVREQLLENQTSARERRSGASYLLQGLLGCKHCGHALYGKKLSLGARRGREVTYAYYRCVGSDAYRFGGSRICQNKQVRTDLLEDAVWAEVMRLLNNPKSLEKEYKRRLSSTRKADSSQIQSEQTKLRNSIARMIDSYAEGLIDKQEFEPRVKRAKTKLSQIESQMKKVVDAEEEGRQLRLLIVQFDEFSSRVQSKLVNLDWQTKRDVIRSLVKKVEVGEKGIDVTFRVGGFAVPKTGAG